jgi:hypothetical protein
VFRALLKIPYEARSVAGLQRLRVLLKTIMIRRTKSGVRILLVSFALDFVSSEIVCPRDLVGFIMQVERGKPWVDIRKISGWSSFSASKWLGLTNRCPQFRECSLPVIQSVLTSLDFSSKCLDTAFLSSYLLPVLKTGLNVSLGGQRCFFPPARRSTSRSPFRLDSMRSTCRFLQSDDI